MGDAARDALTEALTGWGMAQEAIDETLDGTAFSLGLVELERPGKTSPPDIAIIVDDRRDPELRELFAWRSSATEADYWAGWDVRQPPLIRVILGSDEQALLRFSVTILKPSELERRFLLSVHADPLLFTVMQVDGAGIWLAPGSAVQHAAAAGGTSDVYDLRAQSLLVCRVADPIKSLDEALAHIGSPRVAPGDPPMNRAERRAAARKKTA